MQAPQRRLSSISTALGTHKISKHTQLIVSLDHEQAFFSIIIGCQHLAVKDKESQLYLPVAENLGWV